MELNNLSNLEDLKKTLYTVKLKETLYHYTSLGPLLNIINTKSLWATQINYFSDLSELVYFRDICLSEITKRLNNSSDLILQQLKNWFKERFTTGHGIYVVCFTSEGNLLSQWRAYCESSKGISIGFNHEKIVKQCDENKYLLGKCIYDNKQQEKIIKKIISFLFERAQHDGPDKKKHPSQSYHNTFENQLDLILQIGALIKNPFFAEEKEWRAVSIWFESYLINGLKYREGPYLIPYLDFQLPYSETKEIELEKVIVGPSKNINRSIESISAFLSLKKSEPRLGVFNSCVPYQPEL